MQADAASLALSGWVHALTYAPGPSEDWPTWRQGLTLNQWYEVPNTSGSPLPPTYGTQSWSGATIASETGWVYWICLGGHGIDNSQPGYGNGNYACNLMADTPAIVQIHAGTPTANLQSGGEVAYTTGPYTDDAVAAGYTANLGANIWYYNLVRPYRVHYPGASVSDPPGPCNRHSYYANVYVSPTHSHDGNARILMLSAGAIRQEIGSARRRQIDGYNITAGVWDDPGSDFAAPPGDGAWPDRMVGEDNEGGFATHTRDRRTGLIYRAAGTANRLFDPRVAGGIWSTGQWTNTGGLGAATLHSSGALIDTLRDRWAGVKTTPEPSIRYFPLNGGEFARILIPNPSVTFPRTIIDYSGQTYDEDNDRYLVLLPRNTGDELWSFDPVTATPTLLATLPDRTPTGPLSGFAHSSALGGVVLCRGNATNNQQNIQFFPTRANP